MPEDLNNFLSIKKFRLHIEDPVLNSRQLDPIEL